MARMVHFSLTFVIAIASLLQLNEAIVSNGLTNKALQTENKSIILQLKSHASARKSLAEMEAAMTYEQAVTVLDTSMADHKPWKFIQDHLKKHHHHHKKLRKHTTHVKGQYTPTDEAPKDYSGGVWAALYKINDMLLETVEKGDLEELRCASYRRTADKLIEEINEDLATLIILNGEAMADKNAASAKVDFHKGEGDKVEYDLKAFIKEMEVELTLLHAQLRVATSDAEVMAKILNMTQCSDKTAKAGAMMQMDADLLECTNSKTNKTYSKVNIKSKQLSDQFRNMKHPKVMSLLRAAGIDVGDDTKVGLSTLQTHISMSQQGAACGCSCHNDTTLAVLFGAEQNNNTCNIKDPKNFEFLADCCVRGDKVAPCCPTPTLAPEDAYGVEVVSTSSDKTTADYMEAGSSEKCSLSESSKCPELRERFLNINGGIWDTITQLKHLITTTEDRKDEGVRVMQAELGFHSGVAGSQNEKMARAMAQLKTIAESKRMKTTLLLTTQKQYAEEVQEPEEPLGKCPKFLAENDNERCALTVIRGELLAMDALPNNVTDCETSKWTPEECSLTCGGGIQVLVRTQEIEPDHGHHCPALQARQSCNEARCPLDCELEDWTGWSPCSAMCDGGVRDRIRPVVVHPTAGGMPCESSDDSQDCNGQACDKDCVLNDWTEWYASCTKVCGGGRQVRYKHVKEHEFGEMGTCASFHDATRFQWKPCNTQPCQFDDTKQVLCEAKLDIILALDGSGSLGAAGWAAIQLAGGAFAAAMGSGVKLGAMVFSSPYYQTEMEVCMGWKPASAWPEHSDCGITWLSRMTTDTGAVAQSIRDHEPDFRGTLTNIAIDYAEVELSNRGRSYANSVVVIITDGYPESPARTWVSAQKFMSAGRLLMVPVGGDYGGNPDYFNALVSYPWQDNIVSVLDFKELTARSTMDTILSDFCPNIVETEHHLIGTPTM